jgi:hypothetical protein
MFRIRQQQMRTLGDQAFIASLEQALGEDFYGRKPTKEELVRAPFREMIEHGMVVARGYGLETQRDLAGFVLNMIRINPEFHKQPRINAILKDTSLEPPERREKLLTCVSGDEWEEAARMTNADDYWDRELPAPIAHT